MDKLMTIEEVAEYLNLEYKSAYKLVRSGEIPAARIGRVYRVSSDDLAAYIEQQKQHVYREVRGQDHIAMMDIRCGGCGEKIVSELGIKGRCEVCQAALCAECFGVNKIKRCQSHQDKTEEAGGKGSKRK